MKRLRALLKLAVESLDLGDTASDMTGSGTFMDVMVYLLGTQWSPPVLYRTCPHLLCTVYQSSNSCEASGVH